MSRNVGDFVLIPVTVIELAPCNCFGIRNSYIIVAVLSDFNIMNNMRAAAVRHFKAACPKMNNLVSCRNIDNINDVIFGFFGYGKRQFNLNTVRNITISLRDRRSTLMVKLVNIRTVCKRDQRTDFLTGHSGFAEVFGGVGDFSDFIQPIANLNGGGGGLLPCEPDFKLVHTADLVHIDAVNVDMNGVARIDAGCAVFVVQNGGNCVAVHEGIPVIGKRHHTGGCRRGVCSFFSDKLFGEHGVASVLMFGVKIRKNLVKCL